MILRLAEHLQVPLRARNELLTTAGFAAAYPMRALTDPALAPALQTVRILLQAHEPYPAFAIDRHWTIVASNEGFRPFSACGALPGQARIIASAVPGFFGVPGNIVSAEMMQWWAQQLLRCPLNSMLELHHAFTETDFGADVRKITLPTLIIHGDNDASAPIEVTARRTAAMISGGRLEMYEGAAHGLPITHMERLNRDLLAFARA
jgi:pimeloyl-ACP methyl ester carboxylesterase